MESEIPATIPAGSFEGRSLVYVPNGSQEAYKAADGWKDIAHVIPYLKGKSGEG